MCQYFENARTCSRRIRLYSAFALCALASTNVAAQDFRVFTARDHAVRAGVDVRVIDIGAASAIEMALAAGLPSDPAQAAEMFRWRLTGGSEGLLRRLTEAYQDVTDAWSLGVTKIPAVVVDRRYVVYGETDVAAAVARIQAYRSKEP